MKRAIFYIKRTIFIGGIIVTIVLSIWVYNKNKELKKYGVKTKGVVIDVKTTFSKAYIRYRFKDENGIGYISSNKKYAMDGYIVGDTVTIVYVPKNPDNCRLIGLN